MADNYFDKNYELPEQWILTSISELLDVNYGKSLTKKSRISYGDVPVYGSAGIDGYHVEAITESPVIIIGRKGNVGSVYISEEACWPIDTTYYTEPTNSISPYYIYYLLTFMNLINLDTSTTIPGLNRDLLNEQSAVLAPLEEQKRIVDEVEARFSRLDKWLEIMETLSKALPRLRSSILNAAVEGRMVAQNPDDEPADELLQRILEERRRRWEEDYLAGLEEKGKPPPQNDKWKEKYKEPEPPDVEDLPELSEGWVWSVIEEIADVQTGATPLTSNREYYEGGTVPFIKSSALNQEVVDEPSDLITELALKETNAKRFPAGTLLVAMYGEGKTRGNIAELLIEAATNQACAAIITYDTAYECRDFVKLYFRENYNELRRQASGGAQPNLNLGIIRRTEIPLPPLDEQRRIVNEVEAKLSVIERLEATIEVNTKRAEKMRQSILKKAFEGRLVEQNPDDEPASELLKRIREERKRRAEEEKKKPKKPRKTKVKTKKKEKSLQETLTDAGKALTPAELFSRAGFEHSTIDEFYSKLREAIRRDIIVTKRNKNNDVFLEINE